MKKYIIWNAEKGDDQIPHTQLMSAADAERVEAGFRRHQCSLWLMEEGEWRSRTNPLFMGFK